jgi:hypothetical protein
MNRIEDQWHQLKAHEIAGQMFEDEYDLAVAIRISRAVVVQVLN